MKKVLSIMLFSALLLSIGCSNEEVNDVALEESNVGLIQRLLNVTTTTSKPDQPPIWASCDLYSGIVTPANFKPTSHSFDELYVMPMAMFYGGVPLISDSRPGDQDYNGGRWHLNVLKAGVDPAKYAEACQQEDLDPMDFDSTEAYFECPLRPRRN